MPLTDQDKMPFGKYRGQPMEEVPARYLHFLWTKLEFSRQHSPVAEYIRSNLNVLKEEFEDGIWD